jgi:hypothetical protein
MGSPNRTSTYFAQSGPNENPRISMCRANSYAGTATATSAASRKNFNAAAISRAARRGHTRAKSRRIVPLEALINVAGQANVMPLGIVLASQDVDEPSTDTGHARSIARFAPAGFSRDSAVIDVQVRRTEDASDLRGVPRCQRAEEVRLRPLRGLRRDTLRLTTARLPSRSSGVVGGEVGVRLRPFGPTAGHPSHLIMSEGWLAALDDFRNWLVREAA